MPARLLALAASAALLASGCFTLYEHRKIANTDTSNKTLAAAAGIQAVVGAVGGATGLYELGGGDSRNARIGYGLVGMLVVFGLDFVVGGTYAIYDCFANDPSCGDD